MSAWIECAARLQVANDVPAAAETIGQTRSQATAIVSPLDGWRAVWRSQAASPKSARGHDKCCTRATRTEAAHTHLVDCKEHRNELLHAKIGQLALENDFLEGTLTKAGLLSVKP